MTQIKLYASLAGLLSLFINSAMADFDPKLCDSEADDVRAVLYKNEQRWQQDLKESQSNLAILKSGGTPMIQEKKGGKPVPIYPNLNAPCECRPVALTNAKPSCSADLWASLMKISTPEQRAALDADPSHGCMMLFDKYGASLSSSLPESCIAQITGTPGDPAHPGCGLIVRRELLQSLERKVKDLTKKLSEVTQKKARIAEDLKECRAIAKEPEIPAITDALTLQCRQERENARRSLKKKQHTLESELDRINGQRSDLISGFTSYLDESAFPNVDAPCDCRPASSGCTGDFWKQTLSASSSDLSFLDEDPSHGCLKIYEQFEDARAGAYPQTCSASVVGVPGDAAHPGCGMVRRKVLEKDLDKRITAIEDKIYEKIPEQSQQISATYRECLKGARITASASPHRAPAVDQSSLRSFKPELGACTACEVHHTSPSAASAAKP